MNSISIIIRFLEGFHMANRYKWVSGNNNVVFDAPLRALVIASEDGENELPQDFEYDRMFNNWMYIRKRRL